MRAGDFWRSAWADDHNGFAFVLGMCAFWFAPLMFGAIAVMVEPAIWPMLGGAVLAALGWVLAWVVMIRQVRRSEPATIVDVTPALPMVLPAVLMVGGVVICLLSF